MNCIYISVGVVLLILVTFAIIAATAPEGEETDQGFHRK